MTEGRPIHGDTVGENLQDYVQERLEASSNVPAQSEAVHELEQAERDLQKAQAGQLEPTTPTTPQMAPGSEAALEEHLAASTNIRGGAQSNTSNAGSPDVASGAAQDEARDRIAGNADDRTGMGNLRS